MLDATNLQESLGYRVWQPWHRSHILHYGEHQPRLLTPAGPAISAGRSGRLVNIGVREMNSCDVARYVNPTHAGVVQFQTTSQLVVPILATSRCPPSPAPGSNRRLGRSRREPIAFACDSCIVFHLWHPQTTWSGGEGSASLMRELARPADATSMPSQDQLVHPHCAHHPRSLTLSMSPEGAVHRRSPLPRDSTEQTDPRTSRARERS